MYRHPMDVIASAFGSVPVGSERLRLRPLHRRYAGKRGYGAGQFLADHVRRRWPRRSVSRRAASGCGMRIWSSTRRAPRPGCSSF